MTYQRSFTVALFTLAACNGRSVRPASTVMSQGQPAVAQRGATLDADVARVRAATAAYRVLDSAVAAGYPREVANCLQNPESGVMGFHHINGKFVDDKVDLDHPEILLYSHGPNGEYTLNGVEFIVPYSVHSRDAEPPTAMGQALKRSDPLKLWYLHAWVWTENPSGLFADWNPRVKC
jgi:hypothetical protein